MPGNLSHNPASQKSEPPLVEALKPTGEEVAPDQGAPDQAAQSRPGESSSKVLENALQIKTGAIQNYTSEQLTDMLKDKLKIARNKEEEKPTEQSYQAEGAKESKPQPELLDSNFSSQLRPKFQQIAPQIY